MHDAAVESQPSSRIANVLSIAGSDPSGGAGIQADLKAFSARGVYGMAVLTALTAQNTRGVTAVTALEPAFVKVQIEAVFADVRVDAVKIGMIANAGIAEAVAECLEAHPEVPVVLDPVMIAKGGASLLDGAAVAVLRGRLLRRASLVTPNLPEAADILGEVEATTRAAMIHQAQAVLELGARAVLMKGGHLPGPESPDLLLTSDEMPECFQEKWEPVFRPETRGDKECFQEKWEPVFRPETRESKDLECLRGSMKHANTLWLEGVRVATMNTHGTGCSLSSAIAAELAKGKTLAQAVCTAKSWLTGAIAHADDLTVGSGHGPVHHFHALWPPA
ncbi:bifunctional hydroxymethylpyrimidine kinase/phosphomethylpyrimidine kinase [Rhizobium paknamense]|uniref:hydroxymethylpyrimidine kinase n=1 Tax=Rhizobium paknamense TaxID=1206817 RepID=A0ABU0IAP9_9HYPH|nr:bifunctional hydroxymethylpyrimidine kinase/phosphomethylpyrimidine kinase [Rhizobium paknamense]MDQ0455299.1 hydroxymethylpyrimidine/phosphomethylpyrimidine kinase [Rhizobium paknamense]